STGWTARIAPPVGACIRASCPTPQGRVDAATVVSRGVHGDAAPGPYCLHRDRWRAGGGSRLMSVLLGLLVAVSFGSGDVLRGTSSRRVTPLRVLGVVQVCALTGAVVYALALGGHAGSRDLMLGAVAGGLNVVALGGLYAGLATGRMGIVAPLTAMVAACIP